MNVLGKFLVILQVSGSIVVVALALAIFTGSTDWGWKDPRKAWTDPPEGKKEPANERLASELDRRLAAMERANDGRFRAMARVEDANISYAQSEGKFAANRVEYVKELNDLAKAPGPIKVKDVQTDDNGVVLEPTGRPRLGPPIEGLDKSYAKYLEDLEAKRKEIGKLAKEIDLKTKETAEITELLNGKRDKDGKVLAPGYYDLLEIETATQRNLLEELDYVRPLWVRELVNSQLLLARKKNLEKRLGELK